MQIHEINQAMTENVGRDIAASLTNPVAAAKVMMGRGQGAPGTSLSSQISATKMQKRIDDISDRTYNAWKNYIFQVEKTIDPADLPSFRNRSDGRYRKELLSWINNNLSRGLYLPNSQNFGQITNIINQLSGTQQSAQPTVPPTTQPQTNTMQAAIQNNRPISIGGQVIQPNTAQYQSIIQKIQQQQSQQPTTRAPVTEAISQSQEQSLWKKLVTLVLQAQQAVDIGKQQQAQQQSQQQALLNSRSAAQLLQQALGSQGITQSTISSINTVLRNINQQGNIVKSTGNPVTDGLLRLLGFSIQ